MEGSVIRNFESYVDRTKKSKANEPANITEPSADRSNEHNGTIVVVGGGPVSLFYVAQQTYYASMVGKRYHIILYEGRIKEKPGYNNGFEWKGEADNNNRRRQVVTLQSRSWSLLSDDIQRAIFTNGNFFEMWPIGPDSPEKYVFSCNVEKEMIMECNLL